MIILNLDRQSNKALYLQIFQQIKEMVETEVLQTGTPLPSTRLLAKKLGVNRSTVYNAYQELWAHGYIEGKTGSFTRIRKRPKMLTPEAKAVKGSIPWDTLVSEGSAAVYREYKRFRPENADDAPEDLINLAQLDMDHRLFPVEDFRRCMNQVLLEKGPDILGYGKYGGYPPLRETVARRLQYHGVEVSPDEILITNGSQNGIELIVKLFLETGSKVAVEAPTYAILLPLLKYYRAQVVPVPMLEDGMDLEHLEKVLKDDGISFLYTIPNFHNPTGITSTQEHRENVLALCERFGIPIVEDGFEEEMKYFGKVPPPIKSMDKNHISIYLGTFSKVLFPGVRLGWVAAERECIERLTAVKRFSDLTSSFVLQAAVDRYCRDGYYDRHLKKMHRVFRKRMQTAVRGLREHLAVEGIRWTEPAGGYLIWVNMGGVEIGDEEWQRVLLENGVFVSPGDYYFDGVPEGRFFRISISTLDEEEIATGIERLGRAVAQVYA